MNTLIHTSPSGKKATPVSIGRPFKEAISGSVVAKLVGLQPSIPLSTSPSSLPFQWSESTLNSLVNILENDGFSLQQESDSYLLLRRVGWRMRVNNAHSFKAYKELLLKNPAELPALRKSLSMRITDFFENIRFFVSLEKNVFAKLMREGNRKRIHALITNCGTGEEAYSIAMLYEFLKTEQRLSIPMKITACDSDEHALKKADNGYYPHLITADLSPLCLNRFFKGTVEGYQINPSIKSLVHFESEHTQQPSIHSNMDLIVSTEPTLFEDDEIRDRLTETFYKKIRPGGFLVLHQSSHSDSLTSLFKVVSQQHGIYQRRISTSITSPVHITENNQNEEETYPELPSSDDTLPQELSTFRTTRDELNSLKSDIEHLIAQKDRIATECNSLRTMVDNVMKANSDLKRKNRQLLHNTNQWEDLISLCGIGILILDDQLCVNMFTSDVARIFSLKKRDVGRPLSHLDSPFKWNFTEAATTALRSRTSSEQEHFSNLKEWYRIQLSPLIKKDVISGIVCTFFNITESRRENEWDRFRASILNQMEDAVIVTNQSGHITYVNKAAINRFGLHHKKKTGYSIEKLYLPDGNSQEIRETIQDTLDENGRWSGEILYQSIDGKRNRSQTIINSLEDESGKRIGHLNIIRDNSTLQRQDDSTLHHIIEDLTRRNETLTTENQNLLSTHTFNPI